MKRIIESKEINGARVAVVEETFAMGDVYHVQILPDSDASGIEISCVSVTNAQILFNQLISPTNVVSISEV